MRAGISINFHLGQRVVITADHARGKTGRLIVLDMRGDEGIQGTVCLDEPIIIPASDGFKEIHIHSQTLSLLDFAPVYEAGPDEEDVLP